MRVRDLQKMLGLQIWISTVFALMRQFLTPTCDLLRVAQHSSCFFPRRYKDLVARVVFDLTHWRRFILKAPASKFNYVLSRLPESHHLLSSDASSSYGMAGIIQLSPEAGQQTGYDGFFWQITWNQWNTVPIAALNPRDVKINAAEFLAALITCETFSRFCVGCITKLSLDIVTAKTWLDSARCPRYPFDQCAQSTHLFMIKSTMKIKTLWMPSHMNKLADICSRKPFSRSSLGHIIAGVKLMKVRPKFQNVTRFL